MSTILVTGGTGFVGVHLIHQLLAAGHHVRTTVRDLAREGAVRSVLKNAGVDPGDRLSFFAANLEIDDGWRQAIAGCEFVHHVASPFPRSIPKDENELIRPAREGALRVLRTARDAGVKRVVLTSSFAAVGYGLPFQQAPFDETSWTNPDSADVQPYTKSKTLAERAAWDFLLREGGGLELAVVNPVGIFGPVLGPDFSTSILVVRRLLDGDLPGIPNMQFGVIDVRDVADLHIRAMANPAAKGQRLLAVAGDFLTFLDIAKILRAHLGEAARKVPLRQVPDWMVRISAIVDPQVKQILPELSKRKNATNEKARRLLEWNPRSPAEAILATARSLIGQGLVKG
jgi:dihydroflavonol-4-reductase